MIETLIHKCVNSGCPYSEGRLAEGDYGLNELHTLRHVHLHPKFTFIVPRHAKYHPPPIAQRNEHAFLFS